MFFTIPISYTNSRRLKVDTIMQGSASYVILGQHLTMNHALAPALSDESTQISKRVSYGYSNPTVGENVIKKRACANCQLLLNSKEAPKKLCNSQPKSVATTVQEKQTTDASESCEAERPVRPFRIKVRRGVELLFLMQM